MKKLCNQCHKEASAHFFAPSGVCIPCAAKNGESAEVEKDDDYEVVESVECVGGACTL